MKELDKKDKLFLVITSIFLFGGKVLYLLGSIDSNQILIVISIILKALFYSSWILILLKESKAGAIILFFCALVELLVAFLLF